MIKTLIKNSELRFGIEIRRYRTPNVPGEIALTFDDGPSQYTSDVLGILQWFRCSATFFLVGRNVEVLRYINRLSDLLFVLARVVNYRGGRPDIAMEEALVPRFRRAVSLNWQCVRSDREWASHALRGASFASFLRQAEHRLPLGGGFPTDVAGGESR